MKYLKKFENMLDNVQWIDDEINQLKNIGFIFNGYYEPLEYKSITEDLYLDVEKCKIISKSPKLGYLNFKYAYVIAIIKNGKIKTKKFNKNNFDKVFNYVLNIIPEVEREIDKYNL